MIAATESLITGQPVGRMLAAAAPVSLQLGMATIVLTAIVAIPLGLMAALREGTWVDTLILGGALILWAIPPYVIGPLLLVSLLLLFPEREIGLGWGGLLDVRIVLPLAVLALQPVALIVRQTRAVVLDIGLPKMDGISVLEAWRRNGRAMPVLILTARDRWSDKVQGFDAGADDYVAKPFHMEEILARLRALVRRAAVHASSELTCGPVMLDTANAKVAVNGKAIKLTSLVSNVVDRATHQAD